MDWAQFLKEFIVKNKEALLTLKLKNTELRTLKKELEGSKKEPSEYFLNRKLIKDEFKKIINSSSKDSILKPIINEEGTAEGVSLTLEEGAITSFKIKKSKKLDAKKLLTHLVIDGILDTKQASKYEEECSTTVESLIIK